MKDKKQGKRQSFGPLAHAWLEQQTHNLLVLCSTHRRPTKTKPQPSPAGAFRYCTPQAPPTGHTAPLQAAQHPRQYPCGTPQRSRPVAPAMRPSSPRPYRRRSISPRRTAIDRSDRSIPWPIARLLPMICHAKNKPASGEEEPPCGCVRWITEERFAMPRPH